MQSQNVYFAGKLISAEGNAVAVDRLGSVRWNAATGGHAYYPYGVEYNATANDTEKYATYTRDTLTGLDYAMNRYYVNSWGRFTTPDRSWSSARPGSPQSWNRYLYVSGDPVNRKDASGLCVDCKDGDDGDAGGDGGGDGGGCTGDGCGDGNGNSCDTGSTWCTTGTGSNCATGATWCTTGTTTPIPDPTPPPPDPQDPPLPTPPPPTPLRQLSHRPRRLRAARSRWGMRRFSRPLWAFIPSYTSTQPSAGWWQTGGQRIVLPEFS
jgi:RHS repeat-associated protein